MKNKTLDKIMRVISKAYDADNTVWRYYKHPKEEFGDTLARFIAIECSEVAEGNPANRINAVVYHAIEVACAQLTRVCDKLDELRRKA